MNTNCTLETETKYRVFGNVFELGTSRTRTRPNLQRDVPHFAVLYSTEPHAGAHLGAHMRPSTHILTFWHPNFTFKF